MAVRIVLVLGDCDELSQQAQVLLTNGRLSMYATHLCILAQDNIDVCNNPISQNIERVETAWRRALAMPDEQP